MFASWSATLVLILNAAHAAIALAGRPAPRRVKHQVDCATCRVEFTPIATIGKASDPALISQFSSTDRDSRGRFYAFSDYSQVIVYDERGAFMRTIGREGDVFTPLYEYVRTMDFTRAMGTSGRMFLLADGCRFRDR
jgi:hypothetical protein